MCCEIPVRNMLENLILTLYSYLVARVGFICREHSSYVTRQVKTPAFLSHDITSCHVGDSLYQSFQFGYL